jgi:hypothetical protein
MNWLGAGTLTATFCVEMLRRAMHASQNPPALYCFIKKQTRRPGRLFKTCIADTVRILRGHLILLFSGKAGYNLTVSSRGKRCQAGAINFQHVRKPTGQQYGTYCSGSVQYVGYGFPRQVFTYYRNTVGGGHALFSLGSA